MNKMLASSPQYWLWLVFLKLHYAGAETEIYGTPRAAIKVPRN